MCEHMQVILNYTDGSQEQTASVTHPLVLAITLLLYILRKHLSDYRTSRLRESLLLRDPFLQSQCVRI